LPASVISLAAHSRLASTSSNNAPITRTATSNDPINSASTSSATTGADATVASTPGPMDTAAADVSSGFDISNVSDTFLSTMPEQIGYLKAVGLDYGWGPTSMIEWGLEHIHVYSGLPWWSSIIVGALAFRLTLVPLFLKSSDMGARMQAMLPITKPLQAKMMDAFRSGDTETAQRVRMQIQDANKAAGISTLSMFVPVAIQGVFGFCAFKLLRAMSNLPVPGFETGGILWFTDLTQSDPYFMLPAIMALSLHVIFRFGGESGVPMQAAGMRPFLLYAMPFIIFLTTTWLPASLDLWLATTGMVGIVQAALLRRPGIRQSLGMSPLVPTDPRAAGGSGGSSSNSNVLDVKATSRPTTQTQQQRRGGSVRYQAPTINNSGSAPKLQDTDVASGAWKRFTGTVNTGAEKFQKSVNTFMQDRITQGRAMLGQSQEPQSKTRSKQFLRQAAEYERRWQQANKKP